MVIEKLTKRDKLVPYRAVEALKSAQLRAMRTASIHKMSLVLMIGNGLYRIEPNGEQVLLKTLPARAKVTTKHIKLSRKNG